MKKFVKISTKKTYKFGHWYRVDVDKVILPSGKEGEYNVIRMPVFPVVVPLDENGNIYFVKQHRYTINRVSIELPMGHSDGQEIIDAAQRELLEETGLIAKKWNQLGKVYSANGIGEISGQVFVAENIVKVNEPEEMDEESISEVLRLGVSDVRSMIKEGIITDSLTISAFTLADYAGYFDIK